MAAPVNIFLDELRAVALDGPVFRFAADNRFWDPCLSRFQVAPLEIIAPRCVVFAGVRGVCLELLKSRVMSRAEVIDLVGPRMHG
jgi:hypothetical protein